MKNYLKKLLAFIIVFSMMTIGVLTLAGAFGCKPLLWFAIPFVLILPAQDKIYDYCNELMNS